MVKRILVIAVLVIGIIVSALLGAKYYALHLINSSLKVNASFETLRIGLSSLEVAIKIDNNSSLRVYGQHHWGDLDLKYHLDADMLDLKPLIGLAINKRLITDGTITNRDELTVEGAGALSTFPLDYRVRVGENVVINSNAFGKNLQITLPEHALNIAAEQIIIKRVIALAQTLDVNLTQLDQIALDQISDASIDNLYTTISLGSDEHNATTQEMINTLVVSAEYTFTGNLLAIEKISGKAYDLPFNLHGSVIKNPLVQIRGEATLQEHSFHYQLALNEDFSEQTFTTDLFDGNTTATVTPKTIALSSHAMNLVEAIDVAKLFDIPVAQKINTDHIQTMQIDMNTTINRSDLQDTKSLITHLVAEANYALACNLLAFEKLSEKAYNLPFSTHGKLNKNPDVLLSGSADLNHKPFTYQVQTDADFANQKLITDLFNSHIAITANEDVIELTSDSVDIKEAIAYLKMFDIDVATGIDTKYINTMQINLDATVNQKDLNNSKALVDNLMAKATYDLDLNLKALNQVTHLDSNANLDMNGTLDKDALYITSSGTGTLNKRPIDYQAKVSHDFEEKRFSTHMFGGPLSVVMLHDLFRVQSDHIDLKSVSDMVQMIDKNASAGIKALNGSMSSDIRFNNDMSDKQDIADLDGIAKIRIVDLHLKGVNLQGALTSLQNSQEITMTDVGLVALTASTGGIGALALTTAGVTGGLAIASLGNIFMITQNMGPNMESEIQEINIDVKLNDGIITNQDVAMRVDNIRVVALGAINLPKHEYDNFAVSLINPLGCPIITIPLAGDLSNPNTNMSKGALDLLFGKVTGTFNSVTGCSKPIYEGVVKAPMDANTTSPF
jgi:hypothetical protein